MIYEIRIHGRAGQGAKTIAQLLAEIAVDEGKFAQAFPSYGPARRGAAMNAYVRISSKPITIYSEIDQPDAVIVVDESILDLENVEAGLKKNSFILINSKNPSLVGEKLTSGRIYALDASKIAISLLKRDIPNTVLLAAFVKIIKLISLEKLLEIVKIKFEGKYSAEIVKANLDLLKAGFEAIDLRKFVSGKAKKVIKSKKLKTWQEIPQGTVILEPGSSENYQTGSWRSQRPIWDEKKCIHCLICANFCPENCIPVKDSKRGETNLFYCKGCGICSQECPVKAIEMK